MATNGYFSTSMVGNFYFTFEWYRTGYSSSANETYIHYTLTAHNSPGNYRTVYLRNLYVDGKQVYYREASNSSAKQYYDGDVVISGDAIIKGANEAGDANLYASFEAGVGSYPGSNCSGSGEWALDRVPRYANITSFSVSKRDETSVKFNWTADAECDYAWYSKNSGSSWNPLPVNNIVEGLSANTTYEFKLRLQRAGTTLTTDSNIYAQTTYDYPHCTNAPSFTIGNSLNLLIYNPLGRSFNATIVGDNGLTKVTGPYAGTSVSGFVITEWTDFLYSTIPNKPSGNYKVIVSYGNSHRTTNGGTYSITGAEKPTFNSFTYRDVGGTSTQLTGNNQIVP